MLKRSIGGLIAALAMMIGVEAFADASANLAVSATVAESCTISAGAMAFGTIDPMLGPSNHQSTFSVTCSAGFTTHILMDVGQHVSRQMISENGLNYLDYELYTDSFGGTASVIG